MEAAAYDKGASRPRLAFDTGIQLRVVITFFVTNSVEVELDVMVVGLIDFVVVSSSVVVDVKVLFDALGLKVLTLVVVTV